MYDLGYPLGRPWPKTSGFNDPRAWGKHAADDYGCPPVPALASKAGIVSGTGWYGTGGNTVEIGHDNFTIRTRYMHLSRIDVAPGQAVAKGQQIGITGNTTSIVGGVGNHLHFAIWCKTLALALTIQPNPYLTQTWFAVDPTIAIGQPEPVPVPQEDEDMKVIRSPDGLCATLGDAGRRWIATVPELDAYVAAFGPIVHIPQVQMNAIPWVLPTNDIWHILFDPGVGAPDDGRRLMRMSYTLEQNSRILFDPTPIVDPNDKRRMIDTRNMVKAIKDKVGA